MDINNTDVGTQFSSMFMITQLTEKPKKANGTYIDMIVCNKFGTYPTPVWNHTDKILKNFKVGDVVNLRGEVSIFNANKQISLHDMTLVEDTIDMSELIPSYDLNSNAKEYIQDFAAGLSYPYNIILDKYFLNYIYDFENCPAAKKMHHAKIGGLFVHTYNVLQNMQSIVEKYGEELIAHGVDIDRLYFLAIFHDATKIFQYTYPLIGIKEGNLIDHRFSVLSLFDELSKDLDISYKDSEEIKYSLLTHYGPYGEPQPKSIYDYLLYYCDAIDATIYGLLKI